MTDSVPQTEPNGNHHALMLALSIRELLYAHGRPIGRQHRIKLLVEQLVNALESESKGEGE